MAKWLMPKDFMWDLPVCSKCHHETSDPGNFCANCGRKMKESWNQSKKIKKKELKRNFILKEVTK